MKRSGPAILLMARERVGRLLALLVLAALFLAGGAGAAAFAGDPHGGVDVDVLFALGGYPLASALLLSGWLIGRFPLIATIVLCAGIVSRDREAGHLRIYAVRRGSVLWLYGGRLLLLLLVAFALGASLLPAFDLLLLGRWGGAATLVLVASQILVYGSLTALLSAWTGWDAWIAVLLAVGATIWHAMLAAGALAGVPAGGAAFVTLILPPHGALFALESAFAGEQAIPWSAFVYTLGYATIVLALAGISLARRER